ncbi:hypothetical protein K474DRAFT_486650 [Panus rudis PR-1116 ss-1]|nr:hypothetical protein K474DRAFT_486650 [Panus rudis PR-1116 ss-1]
MFSRESVYSLPYRLPRCVLISLIHPHAYLLALVIVSSPIALKFCSLPRFRSRPCRRIEFCPYCRPAISSCLLQVTFPATVFFLLSLSIVPYRYCNPLFCTISLPNMYN